MEAYLDNSATTKIDEEVLSLMERIYREDYGNPSSRHRMGLYATRYLKTAREQIAATLKCKPEEVYFTSGGTESNNTALFGAALANKRRGKHIISSAYEHASVYEPLIFLEELGFTVTYLTPSPDGTISPETLKEALRPDTILVSIMAVNNEVGAVMDIAALGNTVKAYSPDIIFHVDAIQAYGKELLYPGRINVDLLSASSHKFHGPKGCGFLYIREKTKIRPVMLGGGQQKGMRSGTENVPGIAGMGLAAKMAYDHLAETRERMFACKSFFIQGLSELPGVTVHLVDTEDGEHLSIPEREEKMRNTAPHIVSASFEGVRSEVLLHALEDKGIYVSSGSACSSNHPAVSGTLKAIGVKTDLLDATVRFSFSRDTSKEQLSYTLTVLKELLPELRRFRRK